MLHFLVNTGYSVNPTSYHFLRETAFLFPGKKAVNALEKPMEENMLQTGDFLLGNCSPEDYILFALEIK